MNSLSNRCVTIIRILLDESDYIFAEEISEKCGVSLRTVRYDLEKIKGWMKDNGLQFYAVPKKGIKIADTDKDKTRAMLKDDSSDYFFSSEERIDNLLSFFLNQYNNESIEEIGLKTGVSKTTMMRDMEKVAEWFNEHNVRILRKQRKGIGLDISEARRRSLIAAYIVEKINVDKIIEEYAFGRNVSLNYDSQSVLVNDIRKTIDDRAMSKDLRDFIEKNGYQIADMNFIYLLCFIFVQQLRISEDHYVEDFPKNKTKLFEETKEKILGDQIADKIRSLNEQDRENEADYLTDIFLAYIDNYQDEEDERKELTEKIYHHIVSRVYELTHCDISKDQDLNRGMKLHISSMINRIKLKMPYQNVMLEDIKKQYTNAYNMTLEIFSEIENKYGIERNENEIGFVALYVNQALERIYKNTERFRYTRVLLVCPEGQAAVSFLVKSLQNNFNEIRIVDRISAFKADSYDYSKIDLILTTVDLPFTVLKPLIKVKPVLGKRDIARIESFLNKNIKSSEEVLSSWEMVVNDLFRVISKYYDIDSNEALKEDIRIVLGYDNTPLPSLEEVLRKEYFTANIEAYDWEDAVVQAAEPLLRVNAIDNEYLAEIFALKDELGQYALMADGICLVHAAPNNRNKLSMSLATLKDPVMIQVGEDEEPQAVKVMMVFAIKDSLRYAKALDELFTLFTEYPDLADRLREGKTAREIVDIIKNLYDRIEW